MKTMSKILIPTPLRQYAGKQASVEVKAGTVREALQGLVAQHPDLRKHLYTDEGKLRAFVNVYLNDEDVRYLQKDATVLTDADSISIVPSIAGGAPAFHVDGAAHRHGHCISVHDDGAVEVAGRPPRRLNQRPG